MMKARGNIFLAFCIFLVLASCSRKAPKATDTPTTGRFAIGCDETLLPLIDAELDVFHSIYKMAKITPVYLSEENLFNSLFSDTLQMIITTRKLNDQEKDFFNKRKLFPRETLFAFDAIAIIAHPENADSMITLHTLARVLGGEITKWRQISKSQMPGDIQVVFDNPASSNLRALVDSLMKDKKLSKNLSAVDYNSDVVRYVASHPNSLGVIGVNWVSDRDDSTQLSFLKSVRVLALSRDTLATWENSYQPFQAYIAKGWYPLVRPVYSINAQPREGLGSGFTAFLASYRGQLIVKSAGLVPATQQVTIKDVEVKNSW